jgi:hypothetical protein
MPDLVAGLIRWGDEKVGGNMYALTQSADEQVRLRADRCPALSR